MIYLLVKVSLGGSLGRKGVTVSVPPTPISVLTTQAALTDWQNIIRQSPHFSKILEQKGKSNHLGDASSHQ